VIDEEVGYILDLGIEPRFGQRVDSMKALLAEGYDAIFVGPPARPRRARPILDIPRPAGRAAANISPPLSASTGLSSVSFGPMSIRSGKARRPWLGGGATRRWIAAAPSRSARRRAGQPSSCGSGFKEMKASPWEKGGCQCAR